MATARPRPRDNSRTNWSTLLPEFPWDSLAPAKQKAAAHPGGMIDLSIGSPVDPIAPGIALALARQALEPGYPPTLGTPALIDAIAAASARRFGVDIAADGSACFPVIGLKEAIASLPFFLGLGAEHTVSIPELAYPTYAVGARLAGAALTHGTGGDLVFLNSPSNPTGAVLGVEELRMIVAEARARGAIVVSDECYLTLGWSDGHHPVSILHPDVSGGDHSGLLALHSLSKSSNMASYRAGWVMGDPALIGELAEVRKHCGLTVPGPVQEAMVEALSSDHQEELQKATYAQRRAKMIAAFINAGFQIDHSDAGLYLWATRGEPAAATVADLAEQGILVAPGYFYGPAGSEHVRLSITVSDDDVAALSQRLS